MLQVCACVCADVCTRCVRVEGPLTRRSNKSTCLSTASAHSLLLSVPPITPPSSQSSFCSPLSLFLPSLLSPSLPPLCPVILLLKLRGWCWRHYAPPNRSLSASRAEQWKVTWPSADQLTVAYVHVDILTMHSIVPSILPLCPCVHDRVHVSQVLLIVYYVQLLCPGIHYNWMQRVARNDLPVLLNGGWLRHMDCRCALI